MADNGSWSLITMRVATTGGRILEAELRSLHAGSMHSDILHVEDWPMGPREAMRSGLRLLSATEEEQRALTAAGYTLPGTDSHFQATLYLGEKGLPALVVDHGPPPCRGSTALTVQATAS